MRQQSQVDFYHRFVRILLNSMNRDSFPQHTHAYTVVLVVEVDNESERPPPHRLCGNKRVLKGGLTRRRNYGAELKSSEVLDVELEILK